jgi:hypothetical protein
MKNFLTVVLLATLPGIFSPTYGQWPKDIIDSNLLNAAVLHVGDIDGDTDLDVVAAGFGVGDVVWYENGGGTPINWTKWTIDGNLGGVVGVYIDDIDGDDTLDVVAAGNGANDVVWYENGGGTPITWTKWTIDGNLGGAEIVYVADIDGDTDVDVAATGFSANDVVWYENGGGTPITWTKHFIDLNLGSAITCHVADIDGDTDQDVVATGTGADDVVWYENGGGTPITWVKHFIDANLDGAWFVDVGDIDDDTDLDVVATGRAANDVVWYENGGGTPITWTKHTIDANLVDAFVVNISDIDLDGTLDVAATGFSSNVVVWYENDGGTSINWNKHTIDGNLAGANTVFAADLTGNTYPDVFATGWDANDVVWYENPSPPTGIELLSDIAPTSYVLSQNYPNPFNPTSTIEFDLPKAHEVTLKVFNTLGEEVATLVDDAKDPGTYRTSWDASGMASGVYFYRLQAGDFVATKNLVLLK